MIKTISSQDVTSFGGIHAVHQKIQNKRIAHLFDTHLGNRAANAQCRYSDVLLNMCYTAICGGDCAEDINLLNSTFRSLKNLNVPSADVILKAQKDLCTPIQTLLSNRGTENKINVNDKLNNLMLKVATHCGLLDKEQKDYTLDFDHQFIPTEKYDTTYSYKKKRGYFPGIASIDNIPVYIENRNGNSNVGFNQLDTFKRMGTHLEHHGINPARYRMDSGSYIKQITDYIHKDRQAKFYIRAERCDSLLFSAANCELEWTSCEIGINTYQVNSFDYIFGQHSHRIVVYR